MSPPPGVAAWEVRPAAGRALDAFADSARLEVGTGRVSSMDREPVWPAGRVTTVERTGTTGTGAPSRTSMLVACARGWHLFGHGPRAVSADWLAWPLVGGEAEELMAGMRASFGDLADALSTWAAARSRQPEDWLAESRAEQYIILGAGLDSFAWRQDGGVRVFEVDQPSTQAWKRSRLKTLGIPEPPQLVWVPVDFEVESIDAALQRAGCGTGPTFISWLGVLNYLSLEAVRATLRALPPCWLAVSCAVPENMWRGENREASKIFQAMARDTGEPFLTLLTPVEFADVLADAGFALVEEVGPEDIEDRYGLRAVSIADERVVLAAKAAR
jgi:methyltransferase (TIGR00027 family)